MKHLLILGAGTAGTMVANRMRRRLADDWVVTVIDPEDTHLYQPGLLFLPFGALVRATKLEPRMQMAWPAPSIVFTTSFR